MHVNDFKLPQGAWIPNAATMGNLLCGVISIWFAAAGRLELAVIAIVASYICDAVDGHLARVFIRRPTEVSKKFGAELDNLSDMVSFGVAPYFCFHFGLLQGRVEGVLFWALSALGLMYPLFTQFRLARFASISTGGSFFMGLPSPAGGLSLASVIWVLAGTNEKGMLPSIVGFLALAGISVLMTSRVRYSHTRSWFREFRSVGVGLWTLAALAIGIVLGLGGDLWTATAVGLVAFWGTYVFASPLWHLLRGHYRA